MWLRNWGLYDGDAGLLGLNFASAPSRSLFSLILDVYNCRGNDGSDCRSSFGSKLAAYVPTRWRACDHNHYRHSFPT